MTSALNLKEIFIRYRILDELLFSFSPLNPVFWFPAAQNSSILFIVAPSKINSLCVATFVIFMIFSIDRFRTFDYDEHRCSFHYLLFSNLWLCLLSFLKILDQYLYQSRCYYSVSSSLMSTTRTKVIYVLELSTIAHISLSSSIFFYPFVSPCCLLDVFH